LEEVTKAVVLAMGEDLWFLVMLDSGFLRKKERPFLGFLRVDQIA
jgi:hypothetical protein